MPTVELSDELVAALRTIMSLLPAEDAEDTEAPAKTEEEQVAEEFGVKLTGTKANQEKQLKTALAKRLTELGGKPGVLGWRKLLDKVRELEPAAEADGEAEGEAEGEADGEADGEAEGEAEGDTGGEAEGDAGGEAEDGLENEGDESIIKLSTGSMKGCYVVRLEGGKKNAYRAKAVGKDDATILKDPATNEDDFAGEWDGKTIVPPAAPATAGKKGTKSAAKPAGKAVAAPAPAAAAAKKPAAKSTTVKSGAKTAAPVKSAAKGKK